MSNTTVSEANKYRFNHIGSVSHGTINPDHIIPRFIDWLDSYKEDLSLSASGRELEVTAIVGRLDELLGRVERMADEDEKLETLFNAFDSLCPTGIYFGAHPGDGADFGFWVSESFAEDFDSFKSSKEQDYPDDDYSGEWLHVNDHGNVTLYVRENGEDFEVWSCV